MKKIIMAAAALTAGIVMADDSIVSSTVVGYQKRSMMDEKGTLMESYSGGFVFVPQSDTNNFTFNDFTASGMSCGDGDAIQLLDPDTTEVFLSATYADADNYEEGWVGWWDADDIGNTRIDGEDGDKFPVGMAFLANFPSGNKIGFVFSGIVGQSPKDIVTTTESPFICNPLPINLTLKDVTVEGMDCSQDYFQFLDPYTTSTYLSVTYADASLYGEGYKGWWDYDNVGSERVDDVSLPSGQGLLGLIGSKNQLTLTFPAAVN